MIANRTTGSRAVELSSSYQYSADMLLPSRLFGRLSLPQATCAILIAQGGIVAMYLFMISSVQAGDFQAFYFAAHRVVAGEAFVGRSPPTGVDTAWVFPPVIVLYFVPLVTVSLPVALVVQNLFSLAYLVGTAHILIKETNICPNNVDQWLFFGATLFNPLAIYNFFQGQMNAFVLFLMVGGIIAVAAGQSNKGGGALGTAALVKIWPAFIGIWLLWRRDWRATIAATVFGIGGLALSTLLFGVGTMVKWIEVALHRGRLHRLVGGVGPDNTMTAIPRLLATLFPGLPPIVYLLIASLVIWSGVVLLLSQNAPEKQPIATSAVVIGATLLTLPAATFPYLLIPVILGIATLFQTTSSKPAVLLSVGVLLCGAPLNLQDLHALLAAIPFWIPMPPSVDFLQALPPYLLGAILVTVGQAIAINGDT